MTEEEFQQELETVRYFYSEKGDITRYVGWEKFKPILKDLRPDLYIIIENYLDAERAIQAAMNGLK